MSVLQSKGSYILAEVYDLYLYKPYFTNGRLDLIGVLTQLQNSNFEFTVENQTINGKAGLTLYQMQRAKGMAITATSGEISESVLAAQLGSEPEILTDEAYPINDMYTVRNNTIVLPYVAQGTTGSEIIACYVDGNRNRRLTQSASAGPQMFTYTPGSKTLTFSGLSDGTQVAVRYNATAQNAIRIVNHSDKFSEVVRVEGKGRWIDACSRKSYLAPFLIEQGQFDGNFNLDIGDNGAVQNIRIESLVGCGRTVLNEFLITDEEDLVV